MVLILSWTGTLPKSDVRVAMLQLETGAVQLRAEGAVVVMKQRPASSRPEDTDIT